MIVRDRPSGLKMFWLLRGSILPRILPSLLITSFISVLVTYTHGDFFSQKITMTAIPFSLLGLPIAIFLGFRNTAAYDRFWEGRKLWGEILLHSRNLSRQCRTLIRGKVPVQVDLGLTDLRVRMIFRTIAFANALRQKLRDERVGEGLQEYLIERENRRLLQVVAGHDFLMQQMGEDLMRAINDKQIDHYLALNIDQTLSAMTSAAASCERIKSTPIPFSYTLLLHRSAYIYCFLLPFGLVDSIGFMTPFVVVVVAYTFFGLDALGDEIEEPFGKDPNNLPLDAICRNIEIELRQSLGDESLPKPLIPVNFCLN